ncbi:hypothetical protein AB1N83_009799 [Pleurotus pulmonarius]
MPNSSNGGYSYNSSGTNSQGNHYCSRDYGNGSNSYHYSNQDGSYYYRNPNGSTYHSSSSGDRQEFSKHQKFTNRIVKRVGLRNGTHICGVACPIALHTRAKPRHHVNEIMNSSGGVSSTPGTPDACMVARKATPNSTRGGSIDLHRTSRLLHLRTICVVIIKRRSHISQKVYKSTIDRPSFSFNVVVNGSWDPGFHFSAVSLSIRRNLAASQAAFSLKSPSKVRKSTIHSDKRKLHGSVFGGRILRPNASSICNPIAAVLALV